MVSHRIGTVRRTESGGNGCKRHDSGDPCCADEYDRIADGGAYLEIECLLSRGEGGEGKQGHSRPAKKQRNTLNRVDRARQFRNRQKGYTEDNQPAQEPIAETVLRRNSEGHCCERGNQDCRCHFTAESANVRQQLESLSPLAGRITGWRRRVVLFGGRAPP